VKSDAGVSGKKLASLVEQAKPAAQGAGTHSSVRNWESMTKQIPMDTHFLRRAGAGRYTDRLFHHN
jgi:hypothetical protein